MQWCMPYVKYTYAMPGRPNMIRARPFGARSAWEPGSPGPPYASTSTIRPPMNALPATADQIASEQITRDVVDGSFVERRVSSGASKCGFEVGSEP